jgi:seryl-tRNA synthetase
MDFMNNTYEVQFAFQSSCEKLRAFKDALLWLLDKSGKEKSKVKSALEAEIKELKDKLAGLERKIEEVGR